MNATNQRSRLVKSKRTTISSLDRRRGEVRETLDASPTNGGRFKHLARGERKVPGKMSG